MSDENGTRWLSRCNTNLIYLSAKYCRCFLSKEQAQGIETSKTATPPSESQPSKHLVEDLDTKTEVILATAVAVLVIFLVTW